MMLGIFLTVSVICSWRMVSYYSDPSSRHGMATLVINMSVLCALSSILLIPVDIFTTTRDVQILEIASMYIAVYTGLAIAVCILTPFAYFYVDETDSGEEECTIKSATACRSTFYVLVGLAIVLAGIMVVGEREGSHVTTQEAANMWMQALADDDQRKGALYRALLIVMATFIAFGFINVVFYGGFGLASMPIKLIRGNLGADEEKLELEFSRLKLKQEKQAIEKRVSRSKRVREKVNEIERKIKIAERRMAQLDRRSTKGMAYIATIIAPFRVAIGMSLMIISLLVVTTILMGCIDRFFHSKCGFQCGYMAGKSELMPNPFDYVMVRFSEYFPLDYILFVFIALYLFLCVAHGVGRVGIRVLGVQIYKLRQRRTPAQGLLMSGAIVGISAMAIPVILLALSPQYVRFGSQSYVPKDGSGKLPCEMSSLIGEESTCRLTYFARFIGTQTTNNRFFSLAFFFGEAAFGLVSLVSLLHALCRRRDGAFEEELSDDDECESDLDEGGLETIGEELRSLTDRV